ncbi:hypothetical protein L1F06_015455 [Ectopseudomonas hydrolytica]|uniref:Uncharacterized protein n=1 Tax=Ectopseudomonas hydrolytica TaxID=2493633 RepID=A0ABY5A302_9GAMM|nr:hypothetical protein [Pseudomonas hydrolytica]USR38066.1 hypothetical protein L1F06_015455 [Pseudomonas hydrolytica]
MAVHLALYKGHGQVGNVFIRWWTGSIYSHCELVVDGVCYSSSVMDKGVRSKPVGFGAGEIDLRSQHWDLVDLRWADANRVVEYFAASDDDRYGWPSLILSQFLNLNRPVRHAQFCSEWCANALGLPNAPSYSPATLGQLCAWLASGRLAISQ